MVTDQQIAMEVETLLRHSPADAFDSLNGVVQHLGDRFGLDLSHKTALIHREILRYHQFPPPPPQELTPFQKDHFAPQFPPQFAVNFPAGFRGSFPQVAAGSGCSAAPKNAKGSSAQVGAKRRGAGGLNKVCGVSPELQVVVGDSALPRTEIVKQLWVYIRKHNLQDPSNKRKIICDEALRVVFETDCTDMFQMNKLLTKHIHSLTSQNESTSKRLKTEGEPVPVDSLVTISEPLAMFLGTGEKEMLRSEATQYVLQYIKVNQLEDCDTKTVMCDLKLRELFGCENMDISAVADIVARHHLSKS